MTTPNDKGITLVELLITVTILGVLYIGLSGLIKNISLAYRKNTTQLVLQEEARSAMHYITQELQSSRASSIGMVGPFDNVSPTDGGINTSFEFPYGSDHPNGWGSLSPGFIEKTSSIGGPRSGLYSICLNPLAVATTSYISDNFTVGSTGQYQLAVWAKTAAGANASIQIGLTTRNLNQTLNWQWEHHYLNLNYLLNAGVNYNITLRNLAAGTSVYFDDISVSTGTIVMSALTGGTTVVFQKSIEAHNKVRRIRYEPPTLTGNNYKGIEKRGKLYLEQWNGGNMSNNISWDRIEPNPLCQYVNRFTITNNIAQRRFDISLELENDESNAAENTSMRRFNSQAKVTPYLP